MSGLTIDKPSDTVGGDSDAIEEALHHLTATQFRRLGVPLIVYVRACMADDDVAYAIHSADGALMSVVEDIDTATEVASQWGMAVVTVH